MTGDTDATTAPPPLDTERLSLAEAELAAVEHALGRLDAGTWGTCEACGGPIEAASLARRPATRTCDAHGGPLSSSDEPGTTLAP